MRLRITKPGYHDQEGNPVEVGTIITVDGDAIPASLLNKCVPVASDDADADLITGQNTGPTVQEYVAAGYRAENYPPEGYEAVSTPEEIDAAIAEQTAADEAAKAAKTKAKG